MGLSRFRTQRLAKQAGILKHYGSLFKKKKMFEQYILNYICLFVASQQFFVALRLVACAQNGLEVSLKSLNTAVPPPKFVSQTLTSSSSSPDQENDITCPS